MVIVPDAFMASAPQGMLATSLNPQTRHLNFGLTPLVEARLKCPGLDFLEMSGLRVRNIYF
jgi:hypothetical protein